MFKSSLKRIFYKKIHLIVFSYLVIIGCYRSITKSPHYSYHHIPMEKLNISLFRKVNPNLQILKNKPRCQFDFYNKKSISKSDIPSLYREFSLKGVNNGSYSPEHCNPEISVAIIVPYRNRQKQLNIFLPYMHKFLRKQNIHYKIYIIEQKDERAFSRGFLFNVGAKIALSENFPCLILHDVDLLPLNEANLYACLRHPRHMSASIDKFRFVLTYPTLAGGVLAVTANHYQQLNGFSNRFWGWGGEDDDFAYRLASHQLKILRLPRSMSEYTMLVHRQEVKNSERARLLADQAASHEQDGLRSLKYRELTRKHQHLALKVYITT